MNPRVTIAAVVTAAALAAALTVFAMLKLAADSEDRPPIIVRGGSMYLDDGDAKKWKPWKEHGNKREWQPDHPKGVPVSIFSVGIANANGSAAPSSPCPSLAIAGTKVVIEYTTDGGVKSQVVVSIDKSGSKPVPLVTAPADLSSTPGNGSSPAQLVYDPGAGLISSVTVSDDAGAQQICGFVKPAKAQITIYPTR